MKTKFYSLLFLLIQAPIFLLAQSTASYYFRENFGSGTKRTSLPAGTTTYSFSSTNALSDGEYQLYTLTNGRPEWHASKDHTGNSNGLSMVINASYTAGEFYRDTIYNLAEKSSYNIYMYVMNVNTLGTCGTAALLPRLEIIVEAYNPATKKFLKLKSFTTNYFPQTQTPKWTYTGTSFLLPAGYTSVRYRILNNSTGGCGNDLAIDDITVQSPSMAILPVTGFNASAVRTNTAVSVKWETLSETNNSEFIVQKSSNGNDWTMIGSVAAEGNSNSRKEYSIADNNPSANNYYRIMQVDKDGQYTYSNTVTVYMTTVTKTTTFPNPFVSAVQVSMLSSEKEKVTIRLRDMTGKTVEQVEWTLQKGNNNTTMNNLSQLPKGMYMITVTGQNGEQLYSSKIMK